MELLLCFLEQTKQTNTSTNQRQRYPSLHQSNHTYISLVPSKLWLFSFWFLGLLVYGLRVLQLPYTVCCLGFACVWRRKYCEIACFFFVCVLSSCCVFLIANNTEKKNKKNPKFDIKKRTNPNTYTCTSHPLFCIHPSPIGLKEFILKKEKNRKFCFVLFCLWFFVF